MKRPNFYKAQIIFWFVFSIYVQLSSLNSDVSFKIVATNIIIIFFGGFILSSIYRNVLNKINFNFTNIKKVIIAFFIGAFGTLFIYELLVLFFLNDEVNSDIIALKTYPLKYHFSNIVGSIPTVFPWYCIYHFVKYMQSNYELQNKLLITESNFKKLQLENLSAKLNPHFLFNTLNTIKWLINKNTQEARNAVDKISNILRYNLQETKEVKTIEQELEIVTDYLEIEKIRFEDRLRYFISCDDNTKKQNIIPFLILNLIDNAIKHGVAKTENECLLNIAVNIADNYINIKIDNTGVLKSDTMGIGLQSINTLLQNTYGAKAEVKIIQEQLNIVSAIVKYPIHA